MYTTDELNAAAEEARELMKRSAAAEAPNVAACVWEVRQLALAVRAADRHAPASSAPPPLRIATQEEGVDTSAVGTAAPSPVPDDDAITKHVAAYTSASSGVSVPEWRAAIKVPARECAAPPLLKVGRMYQSNADVTDLLDIAQPPLPGGQYRLRVRKDGGCVLLDLTRTHLVWSARVSLPPLDFQLTGSVSLGELRLRGGTAAFSAILQEDEYVLVGVVPPGATEHGPAPDTYVAVGFLALFRQTSAMDGGATQEWCVQVRAKTVHEVYGLLLAVTARQAKRAAADEAEEAGVSTRDEWESDDASEAEEEEEEEEADDDEDDEEEDEDEDEEEATDDDADERLSEEDEEDKKAAWKEQDAALRKLVRAKSIRLLTNKKARPAEKEAELSELSGDSSSSSSDSTVDVDADVPARRSRKRSAPKAGTKRRSSSSSGTSKTELERKLLDQMVSMCDKLLASKKKKKGK